MGWFWRPLQKLMLGVAALSLLAIWLYHGSDGVAHLAVPRPVFGLKYFLSSQSAILWMSMLCFMATVFYWIGLFAKGERSMLWRHWLRAWPGWRSRLALVGTMVRWFESYLHRPRHRPHPGEQPLRGVRHVHLDDGAVLPVLRRRSTQRRALGGFVMLVVSAAVGFLLWYTRGARGARDPAAGACAAKLVDEAARAGQLHWLRHLCPGRHGGLCLPASSSRRSETKWYKLAPLWLLGVALCFEPLAFRQGQRAGGSSYWIVYFGISALIVGGHLGRAQTALPRACPRLRSWTT